MPEPAERTEPGARVTVCCQEPVPEGSASRLQAFLSQNGLHGGGGTWVWPALPAPSPAPGRPGPQSCAFWPAAVLMVACAWGAGVRGARVQRRPGLLPCRAGAWGPGCFCRPALGGQVLMAE